MMISSSLLQRLFSEFWGLSEIRLLTQIESIEIHNGADPLWPLIFYSLYCWFHQKYNYEPFRFLGFAVVHGSAKIISPTNKEETYVPPVDRLKSTLTLGEYTMKVLTHELICVRKNKVPLMTKEASNRPSSKRNYCSHFQKRKTYMERTGNQFSGFPWPNVTQLIGCLARSCYISKLLRGSLHVTAKITLLKIKMINVNHN